MKKPSQIPRDYIYAARYLPNHTSRAHDGDTFYAEVDFGDNMRRVCKIRIAGIDTPERGEEFHKEASLFLTRSLINHRDTHGPWFMIKTKKACSREKYGRLLAEVWLFDALEDRWHSVGNDLLAQGYAMPWKS